MAYKVCFVFELSWLHLFYPKSFPVSLQLQHRVAHLMHENEKKKWMERKVRERISVTKQKSFEILLSHVTSIECVGHLIGTVSFGSLLSAKKILEAWFLPNENDKVSRDDSFRAK